MPPNGVYILIHRTLLRVSNVCHQIRSIANYYFIIIRVRSFLLLLRTEWLLNRLEAKSEAAGMGIATETIVAAAVVVDVMATAAAVVTSKCKSRKGNFLFCFPANRMLLRLI